MIGVGYGLPAKSDILEVEAPKLFGKGEFLDRQVLLSLLKLGICRVTPIVVSSRRNRGS